MASHPNDLFVLGEEELGAEAADSATAPDSVPDSPRARLGGGRASRRLLVGCLLAASVALIAALVAGDGGGERADTPSPRREPAAVVAEPVPSPPARLPAPERARPFPRAAQRKAPRVGAKPSKKRPSGWAEREPMSEQAPVSPPVDEPAPVPQAAPVPVISPPAPSPSRPLRDGSGGRPEFGFER